MKNKPRHREPYGIESLSPSMTMIVSRPMQQIITSKQIISCRIQSDKDCGFFQPACLITEHRGTHVHPTITLIDIMLSTICLSNVIHIRGHMIFTIRKRRFSCISRGFMSFPQLLLSVQ